MSDPDAGALQGAERILSKIGLVLSKTKDALLKDALQNIADYLPDKADLERYSSADFLSEVESGKFTFEDYINGLFRRLGYDISQFEENGELFDLVKSCMAVLVKLGKIVQGFSTTVDWKKEIDSIVADPASAEAKAKPFLAAAKKLYEDGGLGDEEVPTDEGLFGNVYNLFEVIIELVQIIRKFKDLEGGKLLSEHERFLDFLEDSYFNKAFADRILDHILVVMLRNAKEVFADDISALVDNAKDITRYLKAGIEDALVRPVEEIVDEIKELQKEIAELEKQLLARAEELAKAAKEKGLDAIREVSSDLEARLKVAKARLEELGEELFGDYNQFAKILNQIYAVLDFLKVIDKQTIEIARYIPDAPRLPYSSIPAEIDALPDQFNQVLSDVKKSAKEVDEALSGAVAKWKAAAPTVEIDVINWSRFKRIFTEPIDYFQEIYPIRNYDEAVDLMEKVIGVLRAFNPQIPDIEDIQQLLHELLIRISEKIKDLGKRISDSEAARNLETFKEFIFDVLKAISEFAAAVRRELTEAYEQVKAEAKSVFDALSEGIEKEIGTLIKEAKIAGTEIERQLFDSLQTVDNVFFEQVFVDPFVRTVKEKAAEHELFSGINPDAWAEAITDAGAKDANVLLKNFQPLLKSMDEMAASVFSEKIWKSRFKAVIEDLGKEFEKQTENIPTSVKDVEKYGRDAIDKLIKGDLPDNPFSGFDIYRYFGILRDAAGGMLPDFTDLFYGKFLGAVEATIATMTESSRIRSTLSSAKETAADYPDKLKAFAVDVFKTYYKELRKSVYNHVLKPYRNAVEKAVKAWLKDELLPKAVDYIRQNLPEAPDLGDYRKLLSPENLKFARELVSIPREAAEIDSWQDGLQFAIKLYKAVPADVKKAFRELVDLPDFHFDDIKLPAYSLDVKNKFLGVTLYEYVPGKEEAGEKQSSSSTQVSGSVSIKVTAFVGSKEIGGRQQAGLYFLPVIVGDFGIEIKTGEDHKFKLGASASMNGSCEVAGTDAAAREKLQDSGKLGLFFTTKPGDKVPSVVPLDDASGGLKAYLELLFSRTEDNKLMIFGSDPDTRADDDESIASLSILDYPQKIYVGYDNGFDAGYLGGLRNLELNLYLGQVNDFFAKIFKKPIQVVLETLDLGYSIKDGFKINGEYFVQIPLEKDIDLEFVKFNNLMIELGGGANNNLVADFNSTFTADFHGIAISFADLGIGMDINVFDESGGFGDFDITPHFRFPDGIGISIDTEAVSGSGIIKWNKKREEFLGALEISVLDLCSVETILLFNLRMPDGSKGFSFMAALSVTFTPGIQLGMGFQLTRIGGSLGINRRIEQDKLIRATRDGTLGAVLFVDNIKDHLDTVLGNITAYFPAQKEQVFFGFMTQITFSEVIKVDAGLFIQAPDPVVVIIAGGLHISLSEKLDWLLSLHVYFLGMIDFSKGLSFDASLVDSHIVGIDLFGDVAFRLYWAGDTKGFLYSAGGFHPKYKPEAGFRVSDMRRVGMKLDYSVLKFSMESYFAVTSNTVQFGSRVEMEIELYICSISGFYEFNALFQFNPFRFMVDGSAGVKVKCCGITLLAIGIALELSGPAKWHASGEATFTLLSIKKHAHFSKTWGDSQEDSEKQYIAVFPILDAAFADKTNWQIVSSDIVDRLVTFSLVEPVKPDTDDPDSSSPPKSDNLVMKPSDTIFFNQNGVPLEEEIEKYGESEPGDVKQVKITELGISGYAAEFDKLTSSFAPALIKKLTDEEKLEAPSYRKMPSGFALKHGLDEEKGEGAEVSPAKEYVCQSVEDVWAKWQQYASSRPSSAQKTKLSAPKKKSSADKGPTVLSNHLTAKFTEEMTDKKFAPSRRRNEEGVRRYVLESDLRLKRKAGSLIDQLETA